MKRGTSEIYVKDERELADFLISSGLDEAVLKLARGDDRAGRDLAEIVNDARSFVNVLSAIHSRYNRMVVEQVAIAGALNPGILAETEKAEAAAAYVARRLDALSEETERGWTGSFSPGAGFRFEREVRGVKEVATIDPALLDSADARKLDSVYAAPAADLRHLRHLRAQGRGDRSSTARATCSRRSRPPAARASPCSATRASAR